MLRALAVLCLVAPALVYSEGSLTVQLVSTSLGRRSVQYVSLPQNIIDAFWNGYVPTPQPTGNGSLALLVMMCPRNNYEICVLYYSTGELAGVQIAADLDRIASSPYDWRALGYTLWTVNLNGITKQYWTNRLYFLPSGSATIIPGSIVGVSGFYGKKYYLLTNERDAHSQGFTKQACYPEYGLHYMYKMTPATKCRADTLLPWLPLYHEGKLSGVVLYMTADYTVRDGETSAFDRLTKATVQAAVPRAPQCLYDSADSPGIITVHIFVTPDPAAITCPVPECSQKNSTILRTN